MITIYIMRRIKFIQVLKSLISDVDLRREQEYIKNFFEELTDKEFMQMLDEYGNNLILPTKQIYSELVKEGFYD
ncbi:hypothetical protein HMPREF1215_00792 [Coprococcus sp. HPP0074]|nr:hypothetical protein HMPREF1215_00792 [Coprococcus sp. HPP0074]